MQSITVQIDLADLAAEIIRQLGPALAGIQKSFVDHAAPTDGRPKAYLTPKEVCKILSISAPTLRAYTKRGLIPAHRMNRRVLYKPAEVENALKSVNTGKPIKEKPRT